MRQKFLLHILFYLINGFTGIYAQDIPFFYQINSPTELENLFPNDVNAIEQLVKQAQIAADKIHAIAQHPLHNQTYTNTFGAFDDIKHEINVYKRIFDVIANTHPQKEIRNAADHAALTVNNLLSIKILLNKQLYEALKIYTKNNIHKEALSKKQLYFIQISMQKFVCSGLEREKDTFEHIQNLVKEINKLGQEFIKRINDSNAQVILPENQLTGVSQNTINSLVKNDNGERLIPAVKSIIVSILDNCTIQNTRKVVSDLWYNVAYPENEPILTALINKRDELAHVIDFESFAAMELSTQMAKKVETVDNFIDTLATIAAQKAKKQFERFLTYYPHPEELTNKNGQILPWNIRFLINYYKKNNAPINISQACEYFPLNHTINAMLDIFQQFFGLTCLRKNFARWHEDTELIEIYKNNELIGHVILDLFARPYKASIAGSWPTVRPLKRDGKRYPSINVLTMNFPKSKTHIPTLLLFDDVKTLFHEFGHALHGMLGATSIASLSGAQVYTDFLEVPSQLLEMWLTVPEILKKVGRHYKTGDSLPDEIITALKREEEIDAAHYICRQLYYARMSLNYFKEGQNKNIQHVMFNALKSTMPYQAADDHDHDVCAFSHLVNYGSMYYCYMWANVFVKDVFEKIKANGLLSTQNGQELIDKILSIGGAQDPNELLESFLGRQPNQNAFIKFMGLII